MLTLDHWGQYYWTDQYCYKLEAAFSWRTDCSQQLGNFCSFETWIKGCELRHDSEGDILNQSMRENELILISIINGKCKIQIQCCQYNGDFHRILIFPVFLKWNFWIIKSVEFLTEQLNEIVPEILSLKNNRSSFQV